MALFIPDMAGHLFLVILLFDTFQYIEAQGHYLPPPSLTVRPAVIKERDSVQLSCETPSLRVSHCYFNIKGRKNLPDSSCTQTLTGTELLKRADQTFPDVVKVKCYYDVARSRTSPLSKPVSVTVQESETAVQYWQGAVSVASGVAVFLMGLTAVYLCRRTRKTNSQRPTARQDDHRQCDLVMGAVSCACMLDSRDAGINSPITTVPSTFLPSGPVEENGMSPENDNSDTYHVYSSIPDRPATSAQPDGLYSLQTH
ncbi:uncharacterized protein LOC109868942 [Oncorhynchus kisutch]|uniref:uncharacterized protein LOC109868942 n=1 Tax=Oncorhynchus kisutch TaxID=8019 RepID=UPI0012DCB316|nr:uncharacterized protein LOC109868942 [Oncorhynchus kisutch]